VGDECEVRLSDSMMIDVGLLPSIVDIKTPAGSAAEQSKRPDTDTSDLEDLTPEVREAFLKDVFASVDTNATGFVEVRCQSVQCCLPHFHAECVC